MSYSQIKQFNFTWTTAAGADHYRLLERANPDADYVQVGADTSSTSVSLTVSLPRRINASYIVSACNAAGCTDSAPVDVVGSLAEAVGYVKASNTGENFSFGYSVALSGDGSTLAVGASDESSSATGIDGNQTDDQAPGAGAVYVYTRDSLGVWTQEAYVKASNTDPDDSFGKAVALSDDGNTLVVGAPWEDSGSKGINDDQDDESEDDSGAVYVFVRDEMSAWTQAAYVKASNTDEFDQFGRNLALSDDGNTLAVGAPGEASNAEGVDANQTNNSKDGAGAVYVYTRDETDQWEQQAYVKASNTDKLDHFGGALALSEDGSVLAVGASSEDSNATGIDGDQDDDSITDAGAVYLFERDEMSVWEQETYIKASNTGEDFFGHSVALSDDGKALAVGALTEASSATGIDGDQSDDSLAEAGAVYVFTQDQLGSWAQTAYVKASNTDGNDWFGVSVALSDDGTTLVVGAYKEDSGSIGLEGDQADESISSAGALYVYGRDQEGIWAQTAYVKASNAGASDLFGSSVALSDDGSTLAVGARGETSSATGIGGNQLNDSTVDAGAVYLY